MEFVGTDINIKALDCAKRVSTQNNSEIKFIECAYASSLEGVFDIIIFNPPYVVTS